MSSNYIHERVLIYDICLNGTRYWICGVLHWCINGKELQQKWISFHFELCCKALQRYVFCSHEQRFGEHNLDGKITGSVDLPNWSSWYHGFSDEINIPHFYPRPVLDFGYCHRLRLWVCMSVCVCINHELVRTITHRSFKLGSPNLDQRCKNLGLGPYCFGDDRPSSPRSNLTWKSNFISFWACSHHNSSAVQARITKFGPKMHLSIVKIPINFGPDWFWSSLLFSILKPIFLPNLFALFLHYI